MARSACHLALVGVAAALAARHVDATSVRVRPPPLEMGEQVWGGLSRRPGATCESCHPMAGSQWSPFNQRCVESSRETQSEASLF
jgi:hypothetical protein